MKKFIITVDTEGDNLWQWCPGDTITTENSLYIPRFQSLCEEFGFIPTYLTNYEMAMDQRWITYGRSKALEKKCEIGLHIHAWNSPPEYQIENRYGGNAYITEYPEEVVASKICFLKEQLETRFETPIRSARSGRWATGVSYFSALNSNGILIDCSITPGIDLSGIPGKSVNQGNDYRSSQTTPFFVYTDVREIPMTTRFVKWSGIGSPKKRLRSMVKGDAMWLRPFALSEKYLKVLTNRVEKEAECDYLEFMIHSSELMPGGSPYVKTPEECERLFAVMKWYFDYVSTLGYEGISLYNYGEKLKDEKNENS